MPWTKNFDVEEALRKGGLVFWSQGYEATSMTDLLAAMGIQKGSFYDTYGSKRAVYLRALEQYADDRFRSFANLIEDLPAREALRRSIEAVHDECSGPHGDRGCMVVNGALEMAPADVGAQRIIARSLERHERFYADLIRGGQAGGEISPALDADATAKAMLAIVMGMRVFSRSGASLASIRTLADQAIALLDH